MVGTKPLLNMQDWLGRGGRLCSDLPGDTFKKGPILIKIHVFLRSAKAAEEGLPQRLRPGRPQAAPQALAQPQELAQGPWPPSVRAPESGHTQLSVPAPALPSRQPTEVDGLELNVLKCKFPFWPILEAYK